MTTAEEYLASQIGDDTPAISAAEYLDQQVPEDKPTFMSKVENAANAPFAGIMNAATNTALGATQAAASFANQVGILPDTMNVKIPGVGMMDLGYNAGNQGINELKAAKDEDTAATYADDGLSNGLYMGGNVAGDMALFDRLGGNASKVAGPIGNVINKIPYVGKPLASLFPAINAGATSAYVQPAADADQRDSNSIWGGLAGGLGKGLSDTLSTQVLDATKSAALNTAKDFDIPVYRSQVSNNPIVKAVASFEKDVPGSGATGKIEEQVKSFNRAVNSTIGQSGDSVSPETLHEADKRIGGIYEDMKGKYKLPVNQPFLNRLDEIQSVVPTLGDQTKEYALQSQINAVKSAVKNAMSGESSAGQGIIDGKTYQGLRSRIGSLLRGQNSSPELGQLQDLLDSQFQSVMDPADAMKFQTARTQYRNMLSIEKVVANNPNEAISPSKLQGAVKNVFGNYAYGGGSDIERLARLGNILKDAFPNSGTATREQLYDLAKHVAGPAIGVGVGGEEGYRHGGVSGALMGAAGGLALNRSAITPFLYSKMGLAPASFGSFAPGAASAFTNQYNDGSQ